MTILSGVDQDKIIEVSDYLANLADYNVTVADIKKKFGLTNEEYNMIYDLTMPAIRRSNGEKFYKFCFRNIEKEIDQVIRYVSLNPKEQTNEELFDYIKRRLADISLRAEETYRKHELGLDDSAEEETEETAWTSGGTTL